MLDPSIRRFVTEVRAGWARHGDVGTMTPSEARQIAEAVRQPWTIGGPAMAAVTEIDGPVRMRFYDPGPDERKPALIYLHGGGWTLFSLDTHDRVMREYASRAGIVVIGVDYALSPEVKYPVALEQTIAAASYLAEYGAAFGIDPARMGLGGDSAGANLALAAALSLRHGGAVPIRALVLNYGVFARRSSAEAVERFGGEGNMLTAEEMETFWRNYLRDERDAENPLVCPLRADLSRLPPTFLAVPEYDLLAEQSIALAERMRSGGVKVNLEIYRGAAHSFLEAVSISPLAARAFAETSSWLRTALASG